MSLRLQSGMHRARVAVPCVMVAIGAALAFTSGARASTVELRWYNGSPEGLDCFAGAQVTLRADPTDTIDPSCQGRVTIVP